MIKTIKCFDIEIDDYDQIDKVKEYAFENELGYLEDDSFFIIWFFPEELEHKKNVLKILGKKKNVSEKINFFILHL